MNAPIADRKREGEVQFKNGDDDLDQTPVTLLRGNKEETEKKKTHLHRGGKRGQCRRRPRGGREMDSAIG